VQKYLLSKGFHVLVEKESFQKEMCAVYQNLCVIPFVSDLQDGLRHKTLALGIIQVSSHNHNVFLRHILWRVIVLLLGMDMRWVAGALLFNHDGMVGYCGRVYTQLFWVIDHKATGC
jgi:hypothetical protein